MSMRTCEAKRRAVLALMALALAMVSGAASAAEVYPNRPLRITVGYTPGTGADIVARSVAQKLSERVGQQVIVENRDGAGTGIANGIIGKASPDGYSILLATLAVVINPLLYKESSFDPKDLAPVSLLAAGQNVICVSQKFEARTIKDLIALAKARPGQLRYAASGRGSLAFSSMELLKSMAGVDIQEIAYKSSSQAIFDVIRGEIQVYSIPFATAMPQVNSGNLRMLAVTGARRSQVAPDIPTVGETIPGYEALSTAYGFMVPAKTPKEIIARLHREATAITQDRAFRELMLNLGIDIIGSSPQEYSAYIAASGERLKKLFAQLGLKPQ